MGTPELASYPNENEGDGRYYRHPHTGERVPSVTTVTKRADKPAMAQWASDLALKWSVDNWSILSTRSDGDAFKAGRYRWRDVRNERAAIGTGLHETIEADLRGEPRPLVLDPESLSAIEQWEKWYWDHPDFKPEYIEVTVWSHKYGYAGTLDFAGMLDGKMTLGDWKSSKGIWDEHRMQNGALANADCIMLKDADGTWSEVPLPEFEQYALVQIRPDYYDPLKEKFTPGYSEIHYLDPWRIPYYFRMFTGLLENWKAENDMRMKEKEHK